MSCIKRNLKILVLLGVALVTMGQSLSVGADEYALALAERARAILNQRCLQCHGLNGVAKKNIDVSDRLGLISSRVVTPGDPNSLLLRVIESGAMPLSGPALSEGEKVTLRDWILQGATGWASETPSSRAFISEPAVLALIQRDLLAANERARPYLRYFSLTHLYNGGASEEDLEAYRLALAKLINSLSWHREITRPAPIDPAKTVFRIDLRDYQWTAATWDIVLASYPYGIRTPEGEVVSRVSGARLPYVRADWFAASASVAPLYHDLLGLPKSLRELEVLLGVDVSRDLAEEKNVVRAGIQRSGVSQNNRVLQRHASGYGAFWRSFDFSGNLGSENIFRDPIRLNPAGGEVIFNLPNGLQGYFLVDGQGRRIDAAPIAIVADTTNPDDPVVHNGRSCMSCHYAGMQSFKDDVRPLVVGLATSSFDRARSLALYPEQEVLDRLIDKDRDRFQRAVEQSGGRVESARAEPINALSRRFAGELSARQAAAEAGMELKEFQARAGTNGRLLELGLGQLMAHNRTIKRDTWEKSFGEVVRGLQVGDYMPGSLAVSRLALAGTATAGGLRTGPGGAGGAFGRSRLVGLGPEELMRSARSIVVRSMTMFLDAEQLENELRKRPEFQALELLIVKDANVADLQIDLGRPLFTYTFTFSVSNPETSISLTSGKVTAFDGSRAAPKIAKEILNRLAASRTPSSAEPK